MLAAVTLIKNTVKYSDGRVRICQTI